ncbi:PI31 proteasome regulator N-terminal-domain-containing protein, partial [Leucosporidium creatinivorum]
SLTPSSLSSLAVSLLPSDDNSLSSPIEALALLIHSIHTQVGFRLISPASPAVEQEEGAQSVINKLPAGWSSSGSPKFKYKHEQSSLEFVISVTELGGRALVAAVAVENPKSTSFDLLLTDYFSHSTFPLSSLSSAEDFTKAFSTAARLADLITLYRLNILQPLIPGLQKDGYTELPASTSTSSSSGSGSGDGRGRVAQPGGPYYPDVGGPLMGIPGRGGGQAFPPPERGGDDPLRIPGSGGRGRLPNPHDVGRSDLLPLGGMGGTFGSAGVGRDIFGGGGMGGGIGGPGGGGGMMMGRDEFRERFGGDGTVGGRGGQGGGRLWGGDGYLPPGGAPPGARFDPVGPGVSRLSCFSPSPRLASFPRLSFS